MGIHTGEALLTGGDYVGLALHQVARITAAGHGGQILISDATRRLATSLPAGLELRDLGERRLKDLASPERIYQLIGDGLADKFPPLRTLDSKPNNLPVQVTSFIGRAELEAARAVLAGTRLLTLTGPGGMGKTRLALQLAAEESDSFTDGVYFVGLDAIREGSLVAAAIASTLGLSVVGGSEPMDTVIDHLRDRHVLLVLDNFEQVVEAAGDVARLVREAANVKVIVTTRVVLRVYGEQEFPVPPLGLPPVGAAALTAAEATRHEAVRLFAERAMAVNPSFTLTDENAPAVIEVVQRLDGLPLAIELAAARTRVLPVSAIRARLDQHLSLLTGGARDLPERQQTLRGAIDWSYDLLEEPDRRLFERFSVHAGGAYLAQADRVCGPTDELGEDVLDGLSSLAEKSLVRAGLNGSEDPRFQMLVTIRDYAHERLSANEEHSELERRHAQTYLDLVESLAPDVLSDRAAEVTDRLETDHDNIRAAIDWAVENGEAGIALRFLVAAWRFWQTRGHLTEARLRSDAILAMPEVESQPPELAAQAFGAAGGITYWQGDTSATHHRYKRALELAKQTDDKLLIARSTYNFSFAAIDEPKPSQALYAAAVSHLEEALALFEEAGDTEGVADCHWALSFGTLAAGAGYDQAIAHATQAQALYRELGNRFGAAWAAYMIGSLAVTLGKTPEIAGPLEEALDLFVSARDASGIMLTLALYAVAADKEGHRERFLRLGGALERMRDDTGAGIADTPVEFLEFSLPEMPVNDEERKLWLEGRKLSTDEAVALARETATHE